MHFNSTRFKFIFVIDLIDGILHVFEMYKYLISLYLILYKRRIWDLLIHLHRTFISRSIIMEMLTSCSSIVEIMF